jgi:hypothetical protein
MKPGFKVQHLDTRSSDGRNDTLLSELIYRDLNGDLYKVPIGATTDGGSTPRLTWLIPGFEPFGHHWFAWVLHDSGCRGNLLIWDDDEYVNAGLSRLESDQLLDRALFTMGTDKVKRAMIFRGVRIGALSHKTR